MDGSLPIDSAFCPPGITGPSGWLKIDRPGLAFWEDVDHGPGGEPGAVTATGAPARIVVVAAGARHRLADGVLR